MRLSSYSEWSACPSFAFMMRHRAGGETLAETLKNFHIMVDYLEEKLSKYSTKLLWGTANLFSHPRFMAGASTNPDSRGLRLVRGYGEKIAWMHQRLGGSNYVLLGRTRRLRDAAEHQI